MVYITDLANVIIIGAGDSLLAVDTENKKNTIHQIPEPKIPTNLTKNQENVIKERARTITSIEVSKSNEYIATITENKQITVFDTDFKVKRQIYTNRAGSKAFFTPQNDILVADKTGDVYLYKLESDSNEGELILGHLSVLLDLKLSDCGKYIVTCDRDEKIRVSHYPNAYNIVSYCLGHTEFVTNIEICGKYLISASGDGTVRFWDYLKGFELHNINTNVNVHDSNIINSFNAEMDKNSVEVNALPITDMKVFNGNSVFIAVSLHNSDIQLYKVSFVAGKISASFLKCIAIDSNIYSFSLSRNLYVLSNSGFFTYKLVDDNYTETEFKYLQEVFEMHGDLLRKNFISDNISVLYKRKFDNVQEYLERKKQRLEKQ